MIKVAKFATHCEPNVIPIHLSDQLKLIRWFICPINIIKTIMHTHSLSINNSVYQYNLKIKHAVKLLNFRFVSKSWTIKIKSVCLVLIKVICFVGKVLQLLHHLQYFRVNTFDFIMKTVTEQKTEIRCRLSIVM